MGIIFPPSILGAALVGAAAGGGIGHARGGVSRGDEELGEHLGEGQAALAVIGKSHVREQLDKALTRAQKREEREIDADGKDLAKELKRATELAALRRRYGSANDEICPLRPSDS